MCLDFYDILAVATDNHGYVSSSATLTPVTVVVTNAATPTNKVAAVISNLPTNGILTDVYTVVRDGLFDLQGQARLNGSNNAAGLSYQLQVFRAQDGSLAGTVTPGTVDSAGFRSGGDVSGDLGTLDLTVLPNDTYDLVLTVRGGGVITNTTARFILDLTPEDRAVQFQPAGSGAAGKWPAADRDEDV